MFTHSTDVDECQGANKCNTTTSVCYDEYGGHRCVCKVGYKKHIVGKETEKEASCVRMYFLLNFVMLFSSLLPICLRMKSNGVGDWLTVELSVNQRSLFKVKKDQKMLVK